MTYEIEVIVPSFKEEKGVFFSAEEETQILKINLDPLKRDLEELLSMLNSLEDDSKYAIDEINLTAGIAMEESGSKRAGISIRILPIGGEGGFSKEVSRIENKLLEIKIKKIK